MSDDHPTEPLPEQPDAAAGADGSAGADPAGTAAAGPETSGYGQPVSPSAAHAPGASAPAASSTSSHRTLWIALGVGGAAAAVFVLLGGLAFGVVMRHGFDRGDHMGRSSTDQRNGFGDRGPGGMMDDPGNGWGSGGNGSPQDSRGGPLGGALGGPLAGALRDGLHGEMVVPDGSGGYTTVAMQRGSVTDISSSSISVKSSDGFTATYRVDDTTNVMGSMMGGASVSDLSTGDAVVVMAQGSDAPLTVRWVAPSR
jgi:hypothetical protein